MFGRKHTATLIDNKFGKKLGPAINSLGSKLLKSVVMSRTILQDKPEEKKHSYIEK